MCKIISLWFLLAILTFIAADGQGVNFYSNTNHLSYNDQVKIRVAAIFDTIKGKSGAVIYTAFMNNVYLSDKVVNFDKKGQDGWCIPDLTQDKRAQNGIHTMMISFPDSFSRVYQCLVTRKISNSKTKNIFERQKIIVDNNLYQETIDSLTAKIKNDSAFLISLLPIGFKAFVTIDFLKSPILQGESKSILCMSSQVLLSLGTAATLQNSTTFSAAL